MTTLKAVQDSILEYKGRFDDSILYSSDLNTQYRLGLLRIDSTGTLASPSGVLIDKLHSVQLKIEGEGVIQVTSFNKSQSVVLKTSSTKQFTRLFSALIIWQHLKPKGISHKRIQIPFQTDGTPDNLLVASCKIYGYVPKIKNMDLLSTPYLLGDELDTESSGWFSAMVVLKSDGILQFINESDGQLIYSIDIKKLRKSEIRELHHSLFESSNYLFLGIIPKLRNESNTKSEVIPNLSSQYPNKIDKIILEFPYRIDVEDWLVALSSFSIKEFVGIDKSNCLRVSRQIKLGILEAEYSEGAQGLYVEIQIWGKPWFRTAIVSNSSNPFFGENFDIDLPITTTTLVILLKNSKDGLNYSTHDKILGASVIEYRKFKSNTFNDKIKIYNLNNVEIGKFYISSNIQRNYILPIENFNNLENMILNLDYSKLYEFVILQTSSFNYKLEDVSVILLDIFQALDKESEWFNTLIEEEIKVSLRSEYDLSNTLFRGNSVLSKSLELYNLRTGQEYLEKTIGVYIDNLISDFKPIEVDPMRVSGADKEEIVAENFKNLLKFIKEIWKTIYNSSNDLPNEIKAQLSNLRKKIELNSNSESDSIHSISSFIFLRFFCPVILNPKLFFLTKNHQFGEVKRCLTLISKILMKFANLQEFDAKIDPYLVRFNTEFFQLHKDELLDYLDKITLKKLDFSEKVLNLSSSLERTELKKLINNDAITKDQLTVPYLIDKYLRIDQFIDLVTFDPVQDNDFIIDDFGFVDDPIIEEENYNNEDTKSELEKSMTIGSLEFEKLVLENKNDPNSFEFGDEKFIKTLLNTEESGDVFNYINSNTSLQDFVDEANKLKTKRKKLIKVLSSYESVEIESSDDALKVLSTTIIDPYKNVLQVESPTSQIDASFKRLNSELSYNLLKFRFNSPSNYNGSSMIDSASSASTNSSPTKKLGRLIRSASINTLSSFTTGSGHGDDGSILSPSKARSNFGKWFRR